MEPGTNTAATPGPFDGLAKAKPNEPIFTLLGRDEFGPPLVLEWARLVRQRALTLKDKAKERAELIQATEAESVAWAMEEFRKGFAPAPVEANPYSGAKPDAAALAKMEESAARVAGGRTLDNAVAESLDVAAMARGYAMGEEALLIEAAVEMLREASERIRPMRQLRRKGPPDAEA